MQQTVCQFSVGVIADVQYADREDSPNPQGTRERKYKQSIQVLRDAINDFNTHTNMICVMQLGDLIDLYCARFGAAYSKQVLEFVLRAFTRLKHCSKRVHHLIGNHELYNFQREALVPLLSLPHLYSYRSFIPRPGWKFIVLDPYANSILNSLDPYDERHITAKEFLEQQNPDRKIERDGIFWVSNGEGECQSFTPFNGGLGSEQLDWFVKELEDTTDERVIIFSHVPVMSASSSLDSLAWDFCEVGLF